MVFQKVTPAISTNGFKQRFRGLKRDEWKWESGVVFLLFLQKLHVFFHSFQHPFSGQKHEKTNDGNDIVEYP